MFEKKRIVEQDEKKSHTEAERTKLIEKLNKNFIFFYNELDLLEKYKKGTKKNNDLSFIEKIQGGVNAISAKKNDALFRFYENEFKPRLYEYTKILEDVNQNNRYEIIEKVVQLENKITSILADKNRALDEAVSVLIGDNLSNMKVFLKTKLTEFEQMVYVPPNFSMS